MCYRADKFQKYKSIAKRPLYSTLDSLKIKRTFDLELGNFETSLKSFLKKSNEQYINYRRKGFIGTNLVNHFVNLYPQYKIYNLIILPMPVAKKI